MSACPNEQLVGVKGDHIVVLKPKAVMTEAEALVHAAWIVAIVGNDEEFQKILEVVKKQ